ncbi:hypothetical protein DV515_00018743 [Chloebia gouldiae]|uniref:Uncharacterized protein n=1 Tax=Chloebia gouldiae TaxID=44316 RepID=A0A3L8Q6M6_CHLGU|nr:hypothetical protein DV515_00018743 [Chloebia gouldiae]
MPSRGPGSLPGNNNAQRSRQRGAGCGRGGIRERCPARGCRRSAALGVHLGFREGFGAKLCVLILKCLTTDSSRLWGEVARGQVSPLGRGDLGTEGTRGVGDVSQVESRGFVLGRYLCRCKPGFYSAGGVASGAWAGGCHQAPGSPLSPVAHGYSSGGQGWGALGTQNTCPGARRCQQALGCGDSWDVLGTQNTCPGMWGFLGCFGDTEHVPWCGEEVPPGPGMWGFLGCFGDTEHLPWPWDVGIHLGCFGDTEHGPWCGEEVPAGPGMPWDVGIHLGCFGDTEHVPWCEEVPPGPGMWGFTWDALGTQNTCPGVRRCHQALGCGDSWDVLIPPGRGSVPRRGRDRRGVPAGLPAVPPGLCHLRGRLALPDPGGRGAAGSGAVVPGLLHAGHLPQHARVLPLPTEQGKVSPCPPALLSPQTLPRPCPLRGCTLTLRSLQRIRTSGIVLLETILFGSLLLYFPVSIQLESSRMESPRMELPQARARLHLIVNFCWHGPWGLPYKPSQKTKSLFSRWLRELIPAQIPSPLPHECSGCCRGIRRFPRLGQVGSSPDPSLLLLQVFILYFKPSIFRCIVLRWVRMLGFAIVYGTITLKLYRWLGRGAGGWRPPQWEGFGSQDPHSGKGLGLRTPIMGRVWVSGPPQQEGFGSQDPHSGKGLGLRTPIMGRVWVSGPPQWEGFGSQDPHSGKSLGFGSQDPHNGKGLGLRTSTAGRVWVLRTPKVVRVWDSQNGMGGVSLGWMGVPVGWGFTVMVWGLTGRGRGLNGVSLGWGLTGMGCVSLGWGLRSHWDGLGLTGMGEGVPPGWVGVSVGWVGVSLAWVGFHWGGVSLGWVGVPLRWVGVPLGWGLTEMGWVLLGWVRGSQWDAWGFQWDGRGSQWAGRGSHWDGVSLGWGLSGIGGGLSEMGCQRDGWGPTGAGLPGGRAGVSRRWGLTGMGSQRDGWGLTGVGSHRDRRGSQWAGRGSHGDGVSVGLVGRDGWGPTDMGGVSLGWVEGSVGWVRVSLGWVGFHWGGVSVGWAGLPVGGRGSHAAPLGRLLKAFLCRAARRAPYVSSAGVLRLLAPVVLLVLLFLAAWTIGALDNARKNTARGLRFSLCGHDCWDYMMVIGETGPCRAWGSPRPPDPTPDATWESPQSHPVILQGPGGAHGPHPIISPQSPSRNCGALFPCLFNPPGSCKDLGVPTDPIPQLWGFNSLVHLEAARTWDPHSPRTPSHNLGL